MNYRLKCGCYFGFYPREYIISYYGPQKLDWHFVPMDDVIRQEFTGLVKIAILDETSDTCLVEVNNAESKEKKIKFIAYKRDLVKE